MLFEVICQVALIDEAGHGRRERRDGSFGEKLPRSLDTHLDQILVWRQSSRFSKCTNDAERRYSSPLRKHVQRSLVGVGVGILEHIAHDADDARLTRPSAVRIQRVIASVPLSVAAYQFRDRNADGLLSRRVIEIRSVCIAGSVSIAESISGANRLVERLIRSANNWVTEDERAEFGRFAAASARDLRMQSRQSDRKIDRQVREGVYTNTDAPRVHFARWYHDYVALAGEAFRPATPERSRSAEYQS